MNRFADANSKKTDHLQGAVGLTTSEGAGLIRRAFPGRSEYGEFAEAVNI